MKFRGSPESHSLCRCHVIHPIVVEIACFSLGLADKPTNAAVSRVTPLAWLMCFDFALENKCQQHFSFYLLCFPLGTTCACSWGTTSCLVVCPAHLSPTPFWAPTLSRLNWETTSQRSMALTMSATSALHPTRRVSWRREWWSCTITIGQRNMTSLIKLNAMRIMRNAGIFDLWDEYERRDESYVTFVL